MKMKFWLTLSILIGFILPLKATELRKYGVSTTVYFSLIDPAGVDFETAATCAQVGGAGNDDVQISKDGGAMTDSTNCFVSEGNGIYSLVLTATEMQAKEVVVTIIDQSGTKIWLDWAVRISTYGNDSAQHALDLDWEGFLFSQQAIAYGVVDTGTTAATTTTFEADVTYSGGAYSDATADQLVGRVIIFISGNQILEATRITSYSQANSNESFTVTTMTVAPANGDKFVIL